jgi:NADH:ubiquinone oxidoreductase subunit 2 (subunit N)
MIRIKTLLTFTSIYWTILTLRIKPFKDRDSKEINRTKITSIPKEILFFTIIILAGIPPLLGFTVKWIIIIKLLDLTIKHLITVLLVFRAINLFVYFRLINSATMLYSKSYNKNLKKNLFLFNTFFAFINTTSFIVVTL